MGTYVFAVEETFRLLQSRNFCDTIRIRLKKSQTAKLVGNSGFPERVKPGQWESCPGLRTKNGGYLPVIKQNNPEHVNQEIPDFCQGIS
jgi:hypothetical protein